MILNICDYIKMFIDSLSISQFKYKYINIKFKENNDFQLDKSFSSIYLVAIKTMENSN